MKTNTDNLMEYLDTITENNAFRYLINSLYNEVESEEIAWDSTWTCELLKLVNAPTKNGNYRFYVHTGTMQVRFTELETEPMGKVLESKVYTDIRYGLQELSMKYAILGSVITIKNRTLYVR